MQRRWFLVPQRKSAAGADRVRELNKDRVAPRGACAISNQASVSFSGLRPPLAVDARTGMKTRKLGTVFVLLAAMPWLIGCETVRDSPNPPI